MFEGEISSKEVSLFFTPRLLRGQEQQQYLNILLSISLALQSSSLNCLTLPDDVAATIPDRLAGTAGINS